MDFSIPPNFKVNFAARRNKSSGFRYGPPKMSELPKVAGQSVCGAGLGDLGREADYEKARAAKKARATLIDEWTLSQKASVRLFFGTD